MYTALFLFILLFFSKNVIIQYYYKWNRLTNFVRISENTNNIIYIYYTSLVTVYLITLKNLKQLFNFPRLNKIKNNLYCLKYNIEGIDYKILIKPRRGPNNLKYIYNSNGKNITSDILPYVLETPRVKCKPSTFNEEFLIFEYDNSPSIKINRTENFPII